MSPNKPYQAISSDQVMYCMAIRNSVLLQWYNLKSEQKKYVDFLNEIIPDGSIKIKRTSTRVEGRVRHQCCHASNELKKLNLKGSAVKRALFLSNFLKVSILVSDVATAAEMEQEIQRSNKEIQEMQELLDNLSVLLDEWKQNFKNLEKEKELLFLELVNQHKNDINIRETQISNLESENEEMRKHVRKLEKESQEHNISVAKNIGDLSKRQQKRRLQALGTRAQKALWLAQCFGLELDSLEFLDSKGQRYGWKAEVTPLGTPTTADSPPQVTPNQGPSTSLSPTVTQNQYNNLTSESKCKVEAILFLMDKFAVGDAFIHEMSMIVEGMPRSYLIKQCRDKLNSTCAVKPTPGAKPGAQLSFRDSLVNKLRLMVSTNLN